MSTLLGVWLLIAAVIIGAIGVGFSAEALTDAKYLKSAGVLFAAGFCAGSCIFFGCGLLSRCPNCGKFFENKANKVYCSYCGQAFSPTCESCGRKVESGDQYCVWCGNDMKEDCMK